VLSKLRYKKYWRKSSLKKEEDGIFFLKHVKEKKPKTFLEIGVFHGVTSRNVCELLYYIHGDKFKYIGIDLFLTDAKYSKDEYIPEFKFSNPLKSIYYKYIINLNPYSVASVKKLLKKFTKNINIIEGDSNIVLKDFNLDEVDYVFLDGGHKYETVRKDLELLYKVVKNNGTILCDDYNLSYAPGVKKAIDEFSLSKKLNIKILHSRFAEITNSS